MLVVVVERAVRIARDARNAGTFKVLQSLVLAGVVRVKEVPADW